MYITAVPNRSSPPAVLLRESYREGGKVKNRTLANLSKLPPEVIDGVRELLRGGKVGRPLEEAFEVVRTRPHGHVAAVLGTLRRLGLERVLGPACRERALCVAMIVARIVAPRSKLATAQGLQAETLDSTLAESLGVESAGEDHLYAALDWLLERQPRIEAALAKRHLAEGALVLCDVSSSYFEGRTCPLARLGHSRDGRPDRPQIVYGLLTDHSGRPVAVEVFEGNTGDPRTVPTQIQKLRERFCLDRIVLVGDRGMITEARIREDLRPAGLDWITALRAPAIQQLVRRGSIQLSLFDTRDLAEITDPAYPGERLVVCKNPFLADERARKREDLLQATERRLAKIAAAVGRKRRPLRGEAAIALRVGRVIGRLKMEKHFRIEIADDRFSFERDEEGIAREAAIDGLYALRTSVAEERLDPPDVVRSYKLLSRVERAFRSLKSVDLHVRPIHHRLAHRVRAHVLLCMLAYYVEWHMREALAPLLFDDEAPAEGEAKRTSVVAPAQRSDGALSKATTKRNSDGATVGSFRSLLRDLATLAKSRIQPKGAGAAAAFDKLTTPTSRQQRAFDLLRIPVRL